MRKGLATFFVVIYTCFSVWAEDLTVMSYNIHFGYDQDLKFSLPEICQIIREVNPDVVGLNEIRVFYEEMEIKDQPAYLARELGMEYCFAASTILREVKRKEERVFMREGQFIKSWTTPAGLNFQHGNALLSKYPILDYKVHYLPKIRETNERRTCLEVKIFVEGQIYTFLVCHLTANNKRERKLQIERILEIVETEEIPPPIIWLGDFNEKRKFINLQEKFLDCFQLISGEQTEKGWTCPAKQPLMRIDYIFISPNLEKNLQNFYVGDSLASDHLPIVATFKLPSEY